MPPCGLESSPLPKLSSCIPRCSAEAPGPPPREALPPHVRVRRSQNRPPSFTQSPLPPPAPGSHVRSVTTHARSELHLTITVLFADCWVHKSTRMDGCWCPGSSACAAAFTTGQGVPPGAESGGSPGAGEATGVPAITQWALRGRVGRDTRMTDRD